MTTSHNLIAAMMLIQNRLVIEKLKIRLELLNSAAFEFLKAKLNSAKK
jgi:hypothetical protein